MDLLLRYTEHMHFARHVDNSVRKAAGLPSSTVTVTMSTNVLLARHHRQAQLSPRELSFNRSYTFLTAHYLIGS